MHERTEEGINRADLTEHSHSGEQHHFLQGGSPAHSSQSDAAQHQDSPISMRHNVKGFDSSTFDMTRTGNHVYWLYPFLILICLLGGTSTAIAHHLLYYYFRGQTVTENLQEYLHTSGLVLARLVSLLFTIGAAISYRQFVWLYVRRHALRLSTIDTIFSLDQGILGLVVDTNAWKQATLVMLVGGILWAIQIPSFFTPGTLITTILLRTLTYNQTVPMLKLCDFGYKYNSSDDYYRDFESASCYAFYNPNLKRVGNGLNQVITGSIYGQAIARIPSPCGNGNCSFTLDLLAPTWKCESAMLPSQGSLEAQFGTQFSISTGSSAFVVSNTTSYLTNAASSFKEAQEAVNGSFYFLAAAGIAEEYGGDGTPFTLNVTLLTKINPIKYESYYCVLSNTSMTYNFTFGPNLFTTRLINHSFSVLEPDIVNKNIGESYVPYRQSMRSLFSRMTAPFTGVTLGFFDEGQVYDGSGFLSSGGTVDERYSDIRSTPLKQFVYSGRDRFLTGYDPEAPENAGAVLEELSRNISVSLMTIGHWNTQTNVTYYSNNLIFGYNYKTLILAYSLVTGLASLFAVIGLSTMWLNRSASDFSFSTILRTTRNPRLDHQIQGHELGEAPLAEKLKHCELMFGITEENKHAFLLGNQQFVLINQEQNMIE